MTRDWVASSAPSIEVPAGQSASNRTDVEVLFDRLPEPIDLELDLENRVLYWTDRGDPPRGNTVNRAPIDGDSKTRPALEILFMHLMEGIGIAARLQGRPNVPHRSGWLGLFGPSRRVRKADTALRSGKPHGHRIR